MAISGIGNTSSLFSANYNAWDSMKALSLQRAQIQNGSYGKLLKAYVKKVGNKAALDAYRSTGSTTVSTSGLTGSETNTSSSTASISKKPIPRSSFLDDHLKSISKTTVSRATASGKSYLDKHLNAIDPGKSTGIERAIAYAENKTGRAINAAGEFVDVADKYKTENTDTASTTNAAIQSANDRYAALKSTWLDDHLKSYTQDAVAHTAANYSVAIDIAV